MVLTRTLLDAHDRLRPPVTTRERLLEWKRAYLIVHAKLPQCFVHVTSGGFTGGFSSEGPGNFQSLALGMG